MLCLQVVPVAPKWQKIAGLIIVNDKQYIIVHNLRYAGYV